MSNCLPALVASLPGMIIICGLIALFCIVLFDVTPARGQTRTVKFKEPEKIECGICNAIAKANAPQEDVKFATGGLLFKVEKEIRPDSIVIYYYSAWGWFDVGDPEGTWYPPGFQDFLGIPKEGTDISIQESNIT